MTMWSLTRTGIIVAMRKISMLMTSERVSPLCIHDGVFFKRLHVSDDEVQRRTWAIGPFTGS